MSLMLQSIQVQTELEEYYAPVTIVCDGVNSLLAHQIGLRKKYKPKDIMVLVQKRHPFVDALSVALKKRGVDIAGSDRGNLPTFPAIKDLIHLVRFCIDPTNDYSLCCLLKSPIYRLKEAEIFNLCKLKTQGFTGISNAVNFIVSSSIIVFITAVLAVDF